MTFLQRKPPAPSPRFFYIPAGETSIGCLGGKEGKSMRSVPHSIR